MVKRTSKRGDDASFESAARRAGVLTSYRDALGAIQRPPREIVRALCEAIAPQASETSAVAPSITRAGSRLVRFVEGSEARLHERGTALLRLEDGGEIPLRAVRTSRSGTPGESTMRAESPIPLGVHEMVFDIKGVGGGPRRGAASGARARHFVLARPPSLAPIVSRAGRRLAVFLPLYSMTPGGPFGIGTYTDLRDLCDWADRSAGALVGTLPLFPTFLDRPYEPSPYAPISRLMWNEVFVDPRVAPEWNASMGSATMHKSPRSRDDDLIDPRRSWSLAFQVLQNMAERARSCPRRWSEIMARSNAETVRYALFRAAVDATGTGWDRWPTAWRNGRIDSARVNAKGVDAYLYAQCLASEQVAALRRSPTAASPLYLDLPVGVHGQGFDTWIRPDLFLHDFSAGAPPDALNALGQVWEFPPMHPSAGRRDGYAHLRAVLRRMISVAGVLRVDHVMGLYRIFCTMKGHDGRSGTYLRQNEEELFAIVMIEAARAGAVVVGEDLGTVPPPVRSIMKRSGILGMHVQQFAFGHTAANAIRPAGSHTLASLNTHDTPTFAGFWNADDVVTRRSLGHVDADGAVRERSERAMIRRAITAALALHRLPSRTARETAMSLMRLQARGPAPITLVNLEDLWGERRAQNVPGTSTEHPNWRRRAARSLPTIMSDSRIREQLSALRNERRGKGRGGATGTRLR